MLYRIVICLLLGVSLPTFAASDTPAQKDSANQSHGVEKSLVELQRSVAILQVSSASTEDLQSLEARLNELQTRYNAQLQTLESVRFLRVMVFVLFIALLACAYQLYRQAQKVAKLSQLDGKEKSL